MMFPIRLFVGHIGIFCQLPGLNKASLCPGLKRSLVIYFLRAMEKVLRVFDSFDDADRADDEYYASLTPQERVDILLDLIAAYRESLGEAGQRFERVYRVVELSES